MEITLVHDEGEHSPLEVAELGDGLYELRNSGGFFLELYDFGDILRLSHLEGERYELQERVRESAYLRYDFGVPLGYDLFSPPFSDYLNRLLEVSGYWEVLFEGLLFVYVPEESELNPGKDLTALFKVAPRREVDMEEFRAEMRVQREGSGVSFSVPLDKFREDQAR